METRTIRFKMFTWSTGTEDAVVSDSTFRLVDGQTMRIELPDLTLNSLPIAVNIELIDPNLVEPREFGLFKCKRCGWFFLHLPTGMWTPMVLDERGLPLGGGGEFRTRVLNAIPWSEWCNAYAHCAQSIVPV